MNFVKNQ